jgi:GNAT superfamily N-acetyltransferase
MNDRPQFGIGEDANGVEIAGPVREGPRQTHGQDPRIGTEISIRVATPSDSEKLRGMFCRTSSESIYRRFQLPYPEVPEWMIALMLGADHHDKGSLVAVTEEEVVGHAMYARLGDGTEAEIAIIVEDKWQSKGVGMSLLSELAQRARLRGVETFSAEVLATNRPMLGLAAMFAGADYAMADGVCHVRMPLQTRDSAPYTAPADRRAA